MNNMRLVPTRRAPTVEDARRNQKNQQSQFGQNEKKKPPPRPPPPNFAANKNKSKSAWNLSQDNKTCLVPSLIDWSPPSSPKPHKFNGSISSSFSSSNSSLASSKKSFEYESVNHNDWIQVASSTFYQKPSGSAPGSSTLCPTIIRAAPPKKPHKVTSTPSTSASTSREVSPLPPFLANFNNIPHTPPSSQPSPSPQRENLTDSPPMPNIPPPSPPKDASEIVQQPFGVAVYDYNSNQPGDLQFQVNDIVYLIRKVNDDWLYGRVDDQEGMFPKNFIDVQIPLDANANSDYVTARYDFVAQMSGDLSFKAGDCIKILRSIDGNWLMGECNGNTGQFPANFVDRIPKHIL